MVAQQDAKRHAGRVVRRLKSAFPEAECALRHENPLQLLVATILSAQCTDARVNLVTPALFARYPTAASFAAAPVGELEKAIQSTGFYRNKARHIKGCCQALVDEHGGQVPRTLAELVKLPGVGRKTANVVLGTAFGLAEGVVVDTHVTRLAQRLGLTRQKDAVKIEQDLMRLTPRKEWVGLSHRLILHGRNTCIARRPRCDACSLADVCPRVDVKR
jgi:endonuclease III